MYCAPSNKKTLPNSCYTNEQIINIAKSFNLYNKSNLINIEQSPILNSLDLEIKKYVLITMHRPATVDTKEGLQKLLDLILHISKSYKIVFPVHPRTLKNIENFDLKAQFEQISELNFAFQKLIKYSKFILTDSGGIQEESTFLQVPCLTLRPNTERPVTCSEGTNTLIPFDLEIIKSYLQQIENGTYKKGTIPKFWDGKATERIFENLTKII